MSLYEFDFQEAIINISVSRKSIGVDWIDSVLEEGVLPGHLVYLLGNSGTGRRILSGEFLLGAEQKGLWLGVHTSHPVFSGKLKNIWEDAVSEGKILLNRIDLTSQMTGAELLEEIEKEIDRVKPDRLVIDNVDLLETLFDAKLYINLLSLLRAKNVTTILVGTLNSIGKEIQLSPAIMPKLVDYILLTRILLDSKQNTCGLNLVKSPSARNDHSTKNYHLVDGKMTQHVVDEKLEREADWDSSESTTADQYQVTLVLDYINAEQKRMMQYRSSEVRRRIPDASFHLNDDDYSDYPALELRFREFVNGQRWGDFFPIDVCWLRECIKNDLIHPLDEFLDDEWKDQYLPDALQQCTLDGHIWALPYLVNVGALVYRKDILDKYQFQPPTTWTELKDYTDYILKRENNPNLTGFGFQGVEGEAGSCNFLEFLWNNGGDIYDSSHHITVNDEKAVEALQYMQDLIHQWGIAPSFVPDIEEDKTTRYFFNEKLLFMRHWIGVQSLAYIDYHFMKDKIDVAPLPTSDASIPSQSIIGATCYVIPRYVNKPEKLIQYYKEFYTPDTIVELAIKGWGCLPFKSVYTSSDVLNCRPYLEKFPRMLSKGRSRNDLIYYDQLSKLLATEVNLVLKKLKTPREALDRVANELSKNIYHKIHSRRLHTAIDYINQHISEELTRPIVASRCGLSASYFGSLFKEVTGMSFTDYINLKRIELAKSMLKTSDRNIAEISQEVGFSDQSYFCQVFRKMTQMTPTQYRMNILS